MMKRWDRVLKARPVYFLSQMIAYATPHALCYIDL